MPISTDKNSAISNHGVYSLFLACGWTIVVTISLFVSVHADRQKVETIARNVASAYADKDILYRKWNAMHGGVYVSVSEKTTPNPYYPPSVVERDLRTTSGRVLTLINPAFMTRQIYELSQGEQHLTGRITSLKPLRPDNKADKWEADALLSFEQGTSYVSEVVKEDGILYMRYIRTLVTEEGCLACHAQQGYVKGDVRGGISIKLPMSFFETTTQNEVLLWAGHGVIWFLGIVGLYIGFSRLKRRTEERDRAEEDLLRTNALLEKQATTDLLTGISNRRRFLELLQGKLHEAERYGTPLALIFFDIDHFKTVNDTFGHETGDMILQGLAYCITGMLRQTDHFARFGGEEFVILLPQGDVPSACNLAEKIRLGIKEHHFPHLETVTCSFGVTQFYPADTVESIVRRGDEAMYAAKQMGRDRVETCYHEQYSK